MTERVQRKGRQLGLLTRFRMSLLQSRFLDVRVDFSMCPLLVPAGKTHSLDLADALRISRRATVRGVIFLQNFFDELRRRVPAGGKN